MVIKLQFADAHTVQHIVYKWREHNSVLMNKGFKENVINYNLERIKREDCSIVTTTGILLQILLAY